MTSSKTRRENSEMYPRWSAEVVTCVLRHEGATIFISAHATWLVLTLFEVVRFVRFFVLVGSVLCGSRPVRFARVSCPRLRFEHI